MRFQRCGWKEITTVRNVDHHTGNPSILAHVSASLREFSVVLASAFLRKLSNTRRIKCGMRRPMNYCFSHLAARTKQQLMAWRARRLRSPPPHLSISFVNRVPKETWHKNNIQATRWATQGARESSKSRAGEEAQRPLNVNENGVVVSEGPVFGALCFPGAVRGDWAWLTRSD